MPIYEYRCGSCGKQFDVMRSMNDADAPISCKYCQSPEAKRKLSRCYSHSNGDSSHGSSSSGSGSCGGCQGGTCSSCHH